MKFSGDLSRFERARIEVTLRGDRLQRGPYEMKNLSVAAEWVNQTLNINQCEWPDHAGAFAGRASWSRETKEADFQARSTLDAKRFLEAFGFGQLLADATLTSPPLLELSGSANFGETPPRLSVIGRAAAENFTYKTVPLLKLTGDFSWDGERAMLRDLRVRHESGELSGDLLHAPMIFASISKAQSIRSCCARLRHPSSAVSSANGNGAGRRRCVSLCADRAGIPKRGRVRERWRFSARVFAAFG